MQLHTCAAELLYKHNITLVDVQYGWLPMAFGPWPHTSGWIPVMPIYKKSERSLLWSNKHKLLSIRKYWMPHFAFFCWGAHKNNMTLQMTVILQCRFFIDIFVHVWKEGNRIVFFLPHTEVDKPIIIYSRVIDRSWTPLTSSSSLPPSLFIMRLSLACPLKRNHPTFIWSRPH